MISRTAQVEVRVIKLGVLVLEFVERVPACAMAGAT
jgi:hypothetical protein